MTQCTPCMLCGTHRKLATVYRIAARLPRVNSQILRHPFPGSPCMHIPTALYVHIVRKCLEFGRAQADSGTV